MDFLKYRKPNFYYFTMQNRDSVVDINELMESMGASLMDFGDNNGQQQKAKVGPGMQMCRYK